MTQTVSLKNSLATSYASLALYSALYTTVPGATAGTELTGGATPYARQPLNWSAPANGVITATVTHVLPPSVVVKGAGVHSAATGGTYLDGATILDVTTNAQVSPQSTLTLVYTATVS
ncbi:hypothetical protein [Subtercola sp. YIM 133946]|uniref:hypothetical protein n=1 Tax=Subtercola sp. YIM 133946 TaxID=3118909 RepID=UPI002F951C61